MDIGKHFYDCQFPHNAFVHLVNYSFPFLAFIRYKYRLREVLYAYPFKLVYDSLHSKEIRLYASLLPIYTQEKLDINMSLTVAGLLKYCRDHQLDKSVEDAALNDLLALYEYRRYCDVQIMFVSVENGKIVVHHTSVIEKYAVKLRRFLFKETYTLGEYRDFLANASTLRAEIMKLHKRLKCMPRLKGMLKFDAKVDDYYAWLADFRQQRIEVRL